MKGSRINRKIELIANIVIVLSCLVLGARFFFPRLFSPGHRNVPETISAGARFGLQPSQGSPHDLTLVLAVRQGCHYCAESAPFYQRLVRLLKDSPKVHLMAVLPQQPAQGREYLAEMGITVTDVQQGQFENLQIGYTPTLLVLDQTGTVRKVWVGKLSSQRETEVLKELGVQSTD